MKKLLLLASFSLISYSLADVNKKLGNININIAKDQVGGDVTNVELVADNKESLIFRCNTDGFAAYFYASSSVGDSGTVKWKFDGFPANSTATWNGSTSGLALFAPDDVAVKMFKQAQKSKRLTIYIDTGIGYSTTVDTSRFSQATKYLKCAR